ncbi:MAG: hypothetical protein ACK5WD_05535 [bacterium]
MAIRARDLSRLHQRQCVACGYGGRFVDRPGQSHCPRCACDFAERPPKSYAEMEGIDQLEPAAKRRASFVASEPPAREWRLVERWLLFLFGVLAIGISVFALGMAAVVTG